MKKVLLGLSFLFVAGIAMGQGLAKQQSESIATYLGLNPGQKTKVLKVYKKEDDKKAKAHQQLKAKGQSNARKNAQAKNANRKASTGRTAPKASTRKIDPSKGTPPSEIILRISFSEAQKTPGMQDELKAIFTAAQYTKWMELAGN